VLRAVARIHIVEDNLKERLQLIKRVKVFEVGIVSSDLDVGEIELCEIKFLISFFFLFREGLDLSKHPALRSSKLISLRVEGLCERAKVLQNIVDVARGVELRETMLA